MKNRLSIPVIGAVIALLAAGCGNGGKFGGQVPQEGAATPLGDILAKPRAFNNKTVILEGTVSAVCPSFCDFTYSEGTVSAEVFPREFTVKGLKKGDRIRIHAEIVSGKARPVINALGIARR